MGNSSEKSFSLGGVHLGTSAASASEEVPEQPPLRIVVLGDFSGRNGQGARRSELNLRPRLIDRDNLGQVMQQLAPQAHDVPVAAEGTSGAVRFESLDHFHPDQLLRRVPGLKSAPDLSQPERPERAQPVASPPLVESGASLLDQVLEASDAQRELPARPKNQVEQFAQAVMAPYSVPADDPRAETRRAASDQATASALRRLLQQSAFRALEATWRSLDWLTKRVDDDTRVKIGIIDLSAEELRADLALDDLNDSELYQLLVVRPKEQPDDPGWQVIVLDERLGSDIADIELIGRLSQLATDAEAKLLIGLTDEAVGCTVQGRAFVPDDLSPPSEAWRFLQQLPDTARTAALWPGFLLRQPYGKATSAIESLAFEELQGLEPADALLWGNSAYLAADQLIHSPKDPAPSEVTGLPCVILPDGTGEKRQVPAAAWWLRDQSFEQLEALGVTPVAALTQAGAVRVFALRNLQGESL
jgi:hypothetical protein